MNASNPVHQVDFAFYFIFGVSAAIFVGIVATLVYFVIRYSRSRNPVPSRVRGNAFLEVVWTVVPLAIAMAMFALGWQSYIGLRNVPENAMAVKAKALSFQWVFEYTNGASSEKLLVVPVGKPVRLNVESADVVHGLSIPAFRVKVDAIPGRQTYAWFLPDEVGEFDIYCSVYCGNGHADMLAKLRIVSQEEFDQWLSKKAEEW